MASVKMSYTALPSPPRAINLSQGQFEGSVKEEELGASAIKRHTIDAILGLPRVGGFCMEDEDDCGELDDGEMGGKQKFGLDCDGECFKLS